MYQLVKNTDNMNNMPDEAASSISMQSTTAINQSILAWLICSEPVDKPEKQ